jgi:hypothetical protein
MGEEEKNSLVCGGNFVCGDLRKFAEQYGDVIQWDQSNRAYIMTHGVSGIDWRHYKHPLPENAYDVYMQCWNDVNIFRHVGTNYIEAKMTDDIHAI